jgi:hypothetical protein
MNSDGRGDPKATRLRYFDSLATKSPALLAGADEVIE